MIPLDGWFLYLSLFIWAGGLFFGSISAQLLAVVFSLLSLLFQSIRHRREMCQFLGKLTRQDHLR